jgi:hypothetical protein
MGLDWGVETSRLSLFLSEPHAISDKDWAVITGQDEAETRQAVPGGRRLSGSVPNGVMHVSTTGARFDVVLTARAIDDGAEMHLPFVGPYDETFATFFESTRKWIVYTSPRAIRIAFGAVLTYKVGNREEAYGYLRHLLKSMDVDPKNMHDLLYRVNWPLKSKVQQDLTMNRITTWTSVRLIHKLIEISGTALEDRGGAGHVDAVRLELDHNTDEANKALFDQGGLIAIYSELVELARQNAAEGEVPCIF